MAIKGPTYISRNLLRYGSAEYHVGRIEQVVNKANKYRVIAYSFRDFYSAVSAASVLEKRRKYVEVLYDDCTALTTIIVWRRKPPRTRRNRPRTMGRLIPTHISKKH